MIDFLDQQEKIKKYIQDNYKAVLKELHLSDVDAYVDDYLDFDRYTKSKQLFYDFGKYTFHSLSNESNEETLEFTIYLTFRNGKASELKDTMLKYAAAFYEMVERSGGNFGISDFGIIESVAFYNATEANVHIKLCELIIKVETER